jgi:hypothetical protein
MKASGAFGNGALGKFDYITSARIAARRSVGPARHPACRARAVPIPGAICAALHQRELVAYLADPADSIRFGW